MRPGAPLTLAWATALGWGCAGAPAPQEAAPPAAPQEALVQAAPSATCAGADGDDVARFPDENLQLAVRRALGLSVLEPLTCEAVRGLTVLHAPDARISDLRGIEALESLEELHIYGNNSIRDISPLVALPALRDLNLARNQIEDIAPLGEMRSLTSLSLYGNPIQDITPLSELTGLVRLRVEQSPEISDLGPLSGLHALERLELSGNAIVDLAPLAGLAGLRRLSLADNAHLSDLGPLRHLEGLEILLLGGTSVSDLSALAGLTHLSALGLDGTRVSDLGVLIALPHLSQIDLRDNRQLTDIRPLLLNAALGRGDAVRLERTGVPCQDVAALRMNGVGVLARC